MALGGEEEVTPPNSPGFKYLPVAPDIRCQTDHRPEIAPLVITLNLRGGGVVTGCMFEALCHHKSNRLPWSIPFLERPSTPFLAVFLYSLSRAVPADARLGTVHGIRSSFVSGHTVILCPVT